MRRVTRPLAQRLSRNFRRYVMLYLSDVAVLYRRRMNAAARDSQPPGSTGWRSALSGLCMVHCLATTVLLALLSAAGGMLGAPWIHEVGLTLAMIMGAIALGRGILEHGYYDAERGRRAWPRRDGRRADHAARRHRRRSTRSSASRSWRSATSSTSSPPNRLPARLPARASQAYFNLNGPSRSSHASRANRCARPPRERLVAARRAMDRHARGGVRCAGRLRPAGLRL